MSAARNVSDHTSSASPGTEDRRGHDLLAQHSNTKITRRRRMANGAIGLRVPKDVIDAKHALYCTGGKPASRTR